jgi:hypothetical protein
MTRKQLALFFLSAVVIATMLLSATKSRAVTCSNLNGTGWSIPLAESATHMNTGGVCNNNLSNTTISCPGSGTRTVPFLGLGATCTGGQKATFFYQIANSGNTSYSETYAIPNSWTSGSYFWLYAEVSGAESLACGNSPGKDVYGVAYNWCLGSNPNAPTYYWDTEQIPLNQNGEEEGDMEDWIGNMKNNPPDGE